MPPVLRVKNGKPAFPADTGIWFNLTHTDCVTACAIGVQPVGLDLEAVTALPETLLPLFTPEEQRWIAGNDSRFFQLFTMKESLVKLTGEGVGALRELESLITPEGRLRTVCGKAYLTPLTLPRLNCVGCFSTYRPEPFMLRVLPSEALSATDRSQTQ